MSIEFGKVVPWRPRPVSPTGGRVQSNSRDAISALEIVLLALLGVVVGTYGTLVGVGGGFLVVPLLLIIYKLPPAAAAATSLVVVLLNSASGSVTYVRRRRVDIRTGLLLAAATVPGAYFIGPELAERIPDRAFKIGFGLFLLVMAALLFFRPERQAAAPGGQPRKGLWRIRRSFRDSSGAAVDYEFDVVLAVVLSFAVGILSSMLGIGGGIVHVPALIHLMGFPVHVATATSQFVLAFTAAAGVAKYTSGGHVVWPLAAGIGAGVIVGAQVGARVSHRMKGARIIRLLVLAIVLLGLRLIWSAV
ncbi:MAG TPA: sulfite exporter TauE/SafE family protein [Gemmatimonadaceae bacterium]|nr:sulfite exporter TauE/SafE family protein [Gemmatimonadaceae bacterium]